MAARFLEALDNAINRAEGRSLTGYQIQIYNKLTDLNDADKLMAEETNQVRELIIHAQMADCLTEAILLRVSDMLLNGGTDSNGDTINLSNYATKTYVNNLVQSALGENVQADWKEGSSSKPGYIKNKPKTLSAFTNDMGFLTHDSLVGYVTQEDLEKSLEDVDVDLTGYATEEYVNTAVQNVSVDLTGYATEEKVSEMISSQGFLTDIPDEYVTEEELLAKGFLTSIPAEYVTLDQLQNLGLSGTIPEEYITETELLTYGFLTLANLQGYATEEFVNRAILDMASGGTIDLSAYATIQYVNDLFAQSGNGAVGGGPVDLTGYATVSYVDAAVADKVTQSQVDSSINAALAIYKTALQLELDNRYLLKSDYANIEFELDNIDFRTEFYSEGGNE